MRQSELVENTNSEELIETANGRIRYSIAVMEAIQRRALDQFLSIPRGGLEVGGLLFGSISDGVVTVLAHEELTIDHLSGPSFTLSPDDEVVLTERLQQGGPDANGEALQIVGWWHSHTRSDVAITEEDLRVHRKFFPEESQVALILKPFKFDPAQVAIYLPNGNGAVACASFTIGAGIGPPPAPAPEAQPEAESALTPALVVPIERTPIERASVDRVYVTSRPAQRGLGKAWLVALSIVACSACLIAGLYVYAITRPKPQPIAAPDPIRLQVSGSGDQIEVRWDRNAPGWADVVVADLLIVDGDKTTTIPLATEHLSTGSLSYIRKSPKVEVRMRARSRSNELQEAVAHFVGPELPKPEPVRPPQPSPEEIAAKKAADEKAAEVERMKAELERVNDELRRVKDSESRAVQARLAEIRRQGRPVPEPLYTPSRPAQPQVSPTPQNTAPASTQPSAPPTTSTVPASAPQTSSPPPAKPAPTASRPSSGRAIWTGTLPRGGVLLWDGKRPSSGVLTGRMPHSPSRIRVYPADLMESGIVVYTTAAKERIEPPSAANGWNLTTYRGDGRRARELAVLETPSRANNWQRLIVRSEQRTVSMIVFEWDEIPQTQP